MNEKQIKFNQLKSTNEKQKKAIEQLSKELNNTLQKQQNLSKVVYILFQW